MLHLTKKNKADDYERRIEVEIDGTVETITPEEDHGAFIDLERNVLSINGSEYVVERDVATFIWDMMKYADNIGDEYALLAQYSLKQVNA